MPMQQGCIGRTLKRNSSSRKSGHSIADRRIPKVYARRMANIPRSPALEMIASPRFLMIVYSSDSN
jgi:hypothetical protein